MIPSALPSTLDPPPQRIRSFQVRNFADLGDAAPPAREWLVEGLIPMGAVTFISGDGGLGKTLLGQQLIMAAALGEAWCGRPTRPVRSVALFCEDDADEIHRRAVSIARHHGTKATDPRLKASAFLCELGEDNAMMRAATPDEGAPAFRTTMMFDTIRDWALKRQARLVLLDSLHDIFAGNENYRPEARAFVQALTALARDINGAVVVPAHPSLTGLDRGSGTSGSTAWNNAVRSRLYLTRPEGERDDVRVLKTVKANYGRIGETIVLRRKGGVFVVKDGAAPGRRAFDKKAVAARS
jgi:RecA-family ATPase